MRQVQEYVHNIYYGHNVIMSLVTELDFFHRQLFCSSTPVSVVEIERKL